MAIEKSPMKDKVLEAKLPPEKEWQDEERKTFKVIFILFIDVCDY